MQTGLGVVAARSQPFERRHEWSILTLVDQAAGRVPPPAMRTFEGGDQLGALRPAQARRRRRAETVRRDSIDAPIVASAGEIQVPGHIERNVDGLQHFAAHVQTVQCPIGCIDEVHGPEPEIG